MKVESVYPEHWEERACEEVIGLAGEGVATICWT